METRINLSGSQLQAAAPGTDLAGIWEQSLSQWQRSLSTLLTRKFAAADTYDLQAEILACQKSAARLLEARRDLLTRRWPRRPGAVAEALSMTARLAVLLLCDP